MFKKIILFLIGAVFFSLYYQVHASLTINELMYDLSGSDSTSSKSREWIEIYNSGSDDISVDASKWRIYDGSANRTINGEVNFSIPAGSYIIFAGDKDTFLVDHAGFSGTIYDTGITSLNNTGATLKILDQDGNQIDSVSYTSGEGAAGDGNSLQKISGSWAGKLPTPGATNEVSAASSAMGALVNSDSNNSSTTQSASTNTPETKSKTPEEPKIKTKIIAPNLVFVGNPLLFQATAFGYTKEKLFYGKYFWNFGDGDSKEIQANSVEKFSHAYSYAGDYVVTLEYYQNSYSDIPDATDQIAVKVIPADIAISAVGDSQDFFVELSNNTNYDADISSWVISSLGKSFVMSRNTILGSKKKIIISGDLTHFSILDKDTLRLMTPQGKVVFDYGASVLPPPIVVVEPATIESVKQDIVENKVIEKVSTSSGETTAKKDSSQISALPEIPVDNLTASASSSDVVKENKFPYPSLIAFLFIGASAGTVYFVRQRRTVSKVGDDFRILEE